MDSDGHARLTCGVLDLRQQLVRRCEDGRRRPASMVCWWRSDEPRRGSAPRPRGHRSSVRTARHSPPPDDIGVVMEWRPPTALVSLVLRIGRGADCTEGSPEFGSVDHIRCPLRAHEAVGRR